MLKIKRKVVQVNCREDESKAKTFFLCTVNNNNYIKLLIRIISHINVSHSFLMKYQILCIVQLKKVGFENLPFGSSTFDKFPLQSKKLS